ncbi:MAG TPA: hypothetical protein VMP89_10980 [Solirubrobacteraceae bacterium]|nr:hypothetical protein [Solirubrobacteraceae bacterium]
MAPRLLTSSQRLYLNAFDQFLRAGGNRREVERTRRLREIALQDIYGDATDGRPGRELTGDPIQRILRDLRQLGDHS